MNNCLVAGNLATSAGGGSTPLGGGTGGSLLNSSILVWNSAERNGGGAHGGNLNNCLIVSNSAGFWGGGTESVLLNNCTVVGNVAAIAGGGIANSQATNSIIYFNSSPTGANYYIDQYCCYFMPAPAFSCTFPMSPGPGSKTNDPHFADISSGNFRLQNNSDCINAGTNLGSLASLDLDGRPRIVGGTVDMGAYEFQGPNMSAFIGWLKQHSLATDGSADFVDSDGDGMNNWQEWIAGVNPTNPASVLLLNSPVVSTNITSVQIGWQSVNTRTYYLQRSTNLGIAVPFTSIRSNIVGQAGTTTVIDSTTTNSALYYYRVGVQ